MPEPGRPARHLDRRHARRRRFVALHGLQLHVGNGEDMIVIVIAAAAVIGLGAFLKWATAPCMLAFDLGRHVGLITGRRDSERAIIAFIRQLAEEREDGP